MKMFLGTCAPATPERNGWSGKAELGSSWINKGVLGINPSGPHPLQRWFWCPTAAAGEKRAESRQNRWRWWGRQVGFGFFPKALGCFQNLLLKKEETTEPRDGYRWVQG